MEDTFVETRDYEFYWNVAASGYELVDKALYTCPQQPVDDSPLARYNPSHTFFYTQLMSRKWHGVLKPEAVDIEAPWLVPKQGQQYTGKAYELPAPAKGYEPLHDEPMLHRKFASLNIERLESEVVQFADRFGLLGRTVILHPITPGIPGHGESLYRWRAEIEKMGVLLAIWDWVERKEAGKLGQIVRWASPEAVVVRFKWKSQKGHYEILPWSKEDYTGLGRDYNSAVEYESQSDYAFVEELLANDEVVPNDEKPSTFFKQYKRGEALGPARYYLCQMLNYHLFGVMPRLIPWLGYKVAFVPENLLDALWLMFMLEVNGTVRTCWYCRGSLEPTRKDNVYCSNKCKRMAHYYRNREEGGTK